MKKVILLTTLVFIFFFSVSKLDALCPKANKITKMTSSIASFRAVQPLDFSKITSAGALADKAGTKLQVCLSNGIFGTEQMANSFVVPIKKKSEFIAVLNFSNARQPITVGKYSPAAGYGKPFWVTAEVKVYNGDKGVIVSLGVVEGTAEILEMNETTLCGTFNVKNKKGDSAIAGEFNVKLERSRW
ncbi:MAG: hypothetical protein JXI33_07570 [Candidatus Aminicenantes bacterium]|nr:hypothetical protein [Candidatus Aminicenantes bacterium]